MEHLGDASKVLSTICTQAYLLFGEKYGDAPHGRLVTQQPVFAQDLVTVVISMNIVTVVAVIAMVQHVALSLPVVHRSGGQNSLLLQPLPIGPVCLEPAAAGLFVKQAGHDLQRSDH